MVSFSKVSIVSAIGQKLACVIILMSTIANYTIVEAIDLPSIGVDNDGSVSTQEEYRLGQAWLRLFRRQSPIVTEPIINDYVEKLLTKLASRSPLHQQKLSLVVVDHPSINAFAVPGGIIGVHSGLLAFAETEQQFASVLSHELAHLSQRHYARIVEQQRSQAIPTMAALLASLVILATANGDAGMAALSATQAATLDSQLRFSRVFEQEADRIGMDILIRADMDPHAVAEMFENMLRASRYSSRPPEFLLTHPITESRIADSLNRSLQYPPRQYEHDIDYQLVRAHILFQQETIVLQAVKRFQSELSGFSVSNEGSRYGLVLALTADKQYLSAAEYLEPLLAKYPNNPILLIAQSRIAAANNQLQKSLDIVTAALKRAPDNYPLIIHYTELLIASNNLEKAAQLLQKLSVERYFDPYVWYLLAETEGLAQNIVGVHRARAEYFILVGDFERASKQLSNALKLIGKNTQESIIVSQRLLDIDKIKKESEL
jgi:beta-barrel assembly-enhancing protease